MPTTSVKVGVLNNFSEIAFVSGNKCGRIYKGFKSKQVIMACVVPINKTFNTRN